jgi:hypothetical protein
VDRELRFLPYFLEHYQSLGIPPSRIHVILNTPDAASEQLQAARNMLESAGAAKPVEWLEAYTSEAMWEQRRRLQLEVSSDGDWIVNADADEHHRYPAPLDEVIGVCEAKGHNAVQGFLIDRLAPAGRLAEVQEGQALAEQFPIRAEVAYSLFQGGQHFGRDATVKLMLHRADVLPRRGGHNPMTETGPKLLCGARLASFPRAMDFEFRSRFPFQVDHYKWHSGRRAAFENRISTPGVSAAGQEFGSMMLQHLEEHDGVDLGSIALTEDAAPAGEGWQALCQRMRLTARLRRELDRRRGRR